MSQEPDEIFSDTEDISYLSFEWAGLPWSPWVPFTATRPAPIHFLASVREPRPAFDSTRSMVFSGRFSPVDFGA